MRYREGLFFVVLAVSCPALAQSPDTIEDRKLQLADLQFLTVTATPVRVQFTFAVSSESDVGSLDELTMMCTLGCRPKRTLFVAKILQAESAVKKDAKTYTIRATLEEKASLTKGTSCDFSITLINGYSGKAETTIEFK